MVDNSPGEKVSIVVGMITGSPQSSLPMMLWRLAYMEGDVLEISYTLLGCIYFG